MNRLLERSDIVAISVITLLSLALLAYEHLTAGFVDYSLLFLCIVILCIIYLLACLLALALSSSSRGGVSEKETFCHTSLGVRMRCLWIRYLHGFRRKDCRLYSFCSVVSVAVDLHKVGGEPRRS